MFIEQMSSLALALIYFTVGVAFLVALCCGPLLPFWMFLNSLILIAHLPLIKTGIPGQAHFFLLSILNVVRLHFETLEKALLSVVGMSESE